MQALSQEAQAALAKMRADGYKGTPTVGQLQRYGWKPSQPLMKVVPTAAALKGDELKDHLIALGEEAEANQGLPLDKALEVLSLVGSLIP